MLLKKNDLAFDKPTQQSVVENMSMIVKDDLTNDMLYFLKFYQLTNDDQSSYFYIVFYELLSFIIRNDPNKLSQFHVSLLNMFVYILLKNIVLNHYIHHHYWFHFPWKNSMHHIRSYKNPKSSSFLFNNSLRSSI